MKATPEQVEAELTEWREQEESRTSRRDQLVRWAHYEGGFNIHKIHTLSGISRPTIYSILESAP